MRATKSPYRPRHAEASGSKFTGALIMREGIIRQHYSAPGKLRLRSSISCVMMPAVAMALMRNAIRRVMGADISVRLLMSRAY
jgi:hypothetical protein